ncbi:EscU/YscU/HrcU family type III secretion system export apparatus switch protein [Zoogloea sp.]|uniref:EscU/YscU/HrcU family type III secretion system export apparatus switch protein n=1 Tax=Zoogloea sp. TaxID=49181 RepID=UPI00262E11BB|nr:EscU/YscU/HrcU family type III secretion system export apparatus switch protein [Zoogloea sp.]MDD3352514.1 EscU/YscU/HrcU family type III secretion system export apparatus switch protein [Zoogloea sp.]
MNSPEQPAELRSEAVALAYQAGNAAPTVVAKGRGLIAAGIIAKAKEAGVYVHESPELVALLMQVDLDARIPPELYIAVAELLAWLYALEEGVHNRTAPKFPGPSAVQQAGPDQAAGGT